MDESSPTTSTLILLQEKELIENQVNINKYCYYI